MTRKRTKKEKAIGTVPEAPQPETPEKPTYHVDLVKCHKSMSLLVESANPEGIEALLNRRDREGYVLDRLVMLRNADTLVITRKNRSR
jgi:hypothetical protein